MRSWGSAHADNKIEIRETIKLSGNYSIKVGDEFFVSFGYNTNGTDTVADPHSGAYFDVVSDIRIN